GANECAKTFAKTGPRHAPEATGTAHLTQTATIYFWRDELRLVQNCRHRQHRRAVRRPLVLRQNKKPPCYGARENSRPCSNRVLTRRASHYRPALRCHSHYGRGSCLRWPPGCPLALRCP